MSESLFAVLFELLRNLPLRSNEDRDGGAVGFTESEVMGLDMLRMLAEEGLRIARRNRKLLLRHPIMLGGDFWDYEFMRISLSVRRGRQASQTNLDPARLSRELVRNLVRLSEFLNVSPSGFVGGNFENALRECCLAFDGPALRRLARQTAGSMNSGAAVQLVEETLRWVDSQKQQNDRTVESARNDSSAELPSSTES